MPIKSLSFYLSLLLLVFFSNTTIANSYYSKLEGNVYVMDNNPEGNKLIVYGRYSNGALLKFGSVPTGGFGAGDNADNDPLGSQEAIIISEDKRSLYVVNAGSDSISVFYLTRRGRPILIQVISSEGDFPVSLTSDGNFLYTVNAGSDGSISGYSIQRNGRLKHLEGSVRALGTGLVGIPVGLARAASPGDIAFDTLSRRLLIPFGETFNPGDGLLFSFTIDDEGMPSSEAVVTDSPGRLPFAVEFTPNGTALVVNAIGDNPDSFGGGSVSSLNFTSGANLEPVNTVVTDQDAACWVRISHHSNLFYTTNTNVGTISSFRVSRNGTITLVEEIAASGLALPTDFDLTDDDKFLYVISPIDGTVIGYSINRNTGALQIIGEFQGLPTFVDQGYAPQGLAIR